MTRIRTTGAPVSMRRREDGTVKLSTFIPLKIRRRGVSKVIVRPEVVASGEVLYRATATVAAVNMTTRCRWRCRAPSTGNG